MPGIGHICGVCACVRVRDLMEWEECDNGRVELGWECKFHAARLPHVRRCWPRHWIQINGDPLDATNKSIRPTQVHSPSCSTSNHAIQSRCVRHNGKNPRCWPRRWILLSIQTLASTPDYSFDARGKRTSGARSLFCPTRSGWCRSWSMRAQVFGSILTVACLIRIVP